MPDSRLPPDDRVIAAVAKYRSAVRLGHEEYERETQDWDIVDQTNFKGWALSAEVLKAAEAMGKPIHNFNITKRHVDTAAGHIIESAYTPRIRSESGDPQVFGDIFTELHTQDAEAGRWEGVDLKWVRAGFVFRGWKEYYKDYGLGSLPRVGARYVEPRFVRVDPAWKTSDINQCRFIITITYMSAREISENKRWMKTARLKQAVNELRIREARGEQGILEIPWDPDPMFRDMNDQEHMVLNVFWLEKQNIDRVFDAETGQHLDRVPKELREEFVLNRDIIAKSRGKTNLTTLVDESRLVEKVITIIPSLTLSDPVEWGDYELQGNGYHLVPSFMDHVNGHPHTVADILKSPNEMVNGRESAVTALLFSQSGENRFIEKGAADPDEMESLRRGMRRPFGDVYILNPGSGAAKKVWTLPKAQPPNDFMSASEHVVDYMENKLSPVPPAARGQGTSDESGILAQHRVIQALVGLVMAKGFIKDQMECDKNLYIEYARQVYTYPMILKRKNSNEPPIRLNMPGGIYVEDIPRVVLTLDPSPTSQTKRSALIADAAALMQYAGQGMKSGLMREIVENDQNLTEEARARLVKIAEAEIDSVTSSMALSAAQAKKQLSDMQNPQPPSPEGPKKSIAVTAKIEDPAQVAALLASEGIQLPPASPPPTPTQ